MVSLEQIKRLPRLDEHLVDLLQVRNGALCQRERKDPPAESMG
jgi:hypothetical protein